jgi:glycosyltransferase involved in cell wall biosynthesis
MLVKNSSKRDASVESMHTNVTSKIFNRTAGLIAKLPVLALKTTNPILHSPAIVPTNLSSHLNDSDADIVHLHWVNHDTFSIKDIGRLKKPVVWTLHDMWAFCGAEHLALDNRWRDGYMVKNRPEHESGFDLNRWIWLLKIRQWTRRFQVVTPSTWLAECARQSVLMRNWPIRVVPNAIDTDEWCPLNKVEARNLLNLPLDVPLLLFGAWGGIVEPHKGFDLLLVALKHLRDKIPKLELVVFGQFAPTPPVDFGFRVHFLGRFQDDEKLQHLYSAVDVTVVPSRQESFGQVASESHACGTPVVAFKTTGLIDIVEHHKTGYLAKAFDPEDLATGVMWVLADSERTCELGQAARSRAVKLWSYETVSAQYTSIYRETIDTYLK